MATIGATANLFLSVSKPPPQNLSLPLQQGTFLLNKPVLVFKKVPLSSSSSNPVIIDEEEEQEQEQLNDSESVLSSTRGCKACGRDELEKGCNGEGRIQGGIATVPGFGWWPIKAYRPCPGFVASGGRYRRRGQSMDEVASGEGKKPNRVVPQQTNDETQPSKKKKKQGPRKFKT